MTRLLPAFALVWVIASAVAVVDARASAPGYATAAAAPILVATLLVPIVCAWLACEVARFRRPRRIFDPRAGRALTLFVLGLALGVLSFAVASVAIAFARNALPDAAVTAASAFVVCLVGVLTLRRARPGACARCAYDLSGATPAQGGLCPECGADVMRIA